MDWRPFSREEAIDICEDFEDLIGTKYTNDEYVQLKVANVAVGPYYDDDIITFTNNYRTSGNAATALDFYNSDAFDVFILANDGEDTEPLYVTSIRTYVEARGITYKFP